MRFLKNIAAAICCMLIAATPVFAGDVYVKASSTGTEVIKRADTGQTDPNGHAIVAEEIKVVSNVLATGAATAANQTAANTKLDSIITNTTGVATAANQTTANTKLDSIITNTGLSVTEVTNYISASSVAATQTGADVTSTGRYRGVIVYLDISAISGATVTCTISQKTPSGSYISILAGAGETATVSRAYAFYPGFTAVTNSKADYFLPKTWRVACVVSGGTTSFTVGYQALP